jgi:hypothetical protein
MIGCQEHNLCSKKKKKVCEMFITAKCRWLTPVKPATQKAEIRRIKVQSQPGEIVCRDPILKKAIMRKRAGGVAQGEGPEFKPQHHTHTKRYL